MDIVVKVDIADLDLNEEIGIAYYNDEGDRVSGKTVAGAVVAELVNRAVKGDYYSGLRQRVEQIRDEQIRVEIESVIAEALNKPLVKTNSWGEASGKETTLRELIMERVRTTLGLSTEDGYRNGSYQHSTTLAKLVRSQVDEALKTEIADAVKAAREAVAAEFGKSVSDVVTEAVRTGLRAR